MKVNDNKEIIKLLKKWRDGDEKTYEKVYAYYYKYVYYIAFQFFHNHEKAEDTVQETFLEVYHKVDTLKDLNAFQGWIKQIAYRKCLNQCTYEKKDALNYSKLLTSYDEDEETGLQHKTISIDQIQLEDAVKLIIERLSKLDERKRMIGYLRFLEGYKAREIAEIMAINIDTVNSNIRRLKQMLKEELEENHYTSINSLYILGFPDLANVYNQLQENVIHTNTKSYKKLDFSKLHVLMLSGVIVFSTVIIVNKDGINQLFSNLKDTKIVSINYSNKITNKPIVLDVSTTNQNYDDIYINDIKTSTIPDNGMYTITIKKNNNILDERQIVITNIDTLPPYIIEKKEEQNQIILYIKDNQGIDYTHIELYENNQQINNINIDKNNNSIALPKQKDIKYFLKVPDIVGNIGEFYVNSYEKEI